MKRLVFSITCLLIASSVAQAETTEWMKGFDAYKAWQKAKGPGLTVMAIECRDTGKPGLHVGDFEYRVTVRTHGGKTQYRWAVGASFGKVEKQALKQGYKRVSYSSFRRKSGLLIRCGVWQRK